MTKIQSARKTANVDVCCLVNGQVWIEMSLNQLSEHNLSQMCILPKLTLWTTSSLFDVPLITEVGSCY